LSEIPEFAQGSRLLEEAYELADDSHSGVRRRNDTDIDHPAAVGELLHERGYDNEVVASAFLHDVLEDTDTPLSEIIERFGPRVGDLVSGMTEDPSIESYEQRKAEHRARVTHHSPRTAAIYAADKLAKARALGEGRGSVSDAQLHHYWQTLYELREAYPDLPFLDELEAGLRSVDARRAHAARQ
jgi:(p)ppGpp synthase/HD superfamily hydrolase